MDEGRRSDLRNLQAVIDNPLKPKGARRDADRAKRKIVKQLRDPRLRRLRRRLIAAAKAYDQAEELKIVNSIKNYLKQQQIEV